MSDKNTINHRHTFLWAIRMMKNRKLYFMLSSFFGFTLIILNIAIVFYTQEAINSASIHINLFIKNVVLLISFILLQIILGALQGNVVGWLLASISYDVKSKFNKKIINLSKSSKVSLNYGDINSIFNFDLSAIVNFASKDLYNILFQATMAFFSILYLGFTNWILLLASIAFLPIAMFLLNKLQKKMGSYFTENSEIRGKASGIATETVKNSDFIKAYNLQNLICDKINFFYKKNLDISIKTHKVFYPILMLSIMLRNLPKFTCICLGGWLALNGHLELEQVVGFILLLDYIVSPIVSIPGTVISLSSTGASLHRVKSILDLPSEREDNEHILLSKDNPILLEARNVTFGYDEEKIILKNVSFNLKQGEQISLIGKSGCGKSSLIKLLMGDYEVDSGTLFLYGEDYQSVSLKNIRNEISLVSQDIAILPFSVSENIAIGSTSKNPTKDEIIDAAKRANAHTFIMNMPEGYDTILGENGINLSGGERQRLSIARAILKQSPIILLDEPTSALDTQSKKIVQQSLKQLLKNKGIIIISHDPSTIIESEKILVMKDGCIIDQGSHKDLMERNEYYKNFILYDYKEKED